MEKQFTKRISTNEQGKLTTPKHRVSISENKNRSSSKKRCSDRFIPSSISKNLISEFQSKNKNNIPENSEKSLSSASQLKSQSNKKSELNYQIILQSEILEESTPKFDENIGTKNVLDLFKINRQLKFHTEVKKLRKIKINKENSIDSLEILINEVDKKVKINKPLKSYQFENVSDNFYLNTLDIFDLTKVAIGTKTGVDIIDGSSEMNEERFTRFHLDTANEIYTVKFLNSNKIIFSDSNCELKIKDLNKEIEILKFDSIGRKFLTIDTVKNEENILFLGSDNSNVDFYDIRQKHKIRNLYKHENNNEVCKIRYSYKNQYVISGGNDNRIIIHDLRKNQIIETFKHKAAVKGLAVNENETILASGGGTFDKTIKIWDLKKISLKTESLTDSQITNLEFCSNNILAVSNGYISNNIILYNINCDLTDKNENQLDFSTNSTNFSKISIFEKHVKRILYMSKSRCNEYLASLSTDGNMRIWKVGKYVKDEKNKKFAEDSVYCGIR